MKQQTTKQSNHKEPNIMKDVMFVYIICAFIGFIGTLIYFIITKYFCYLTGWILPIPFVLSALWLQQKIPDTLLKKAKEYGERAEKPKGFMVFSSFLYIFYYFLYIIPFIIIGTISFSYNKSLTDTSGWFNVYCALGSTLLLILLIIMVKFIRNYIINKRN